MFEAKRIAQKLGSDTPRGRQVADELKRIREAGPNVRELSKDLIARFLNAPPEDWAAPADEPLCEDLGTAFGPEE